MNNLDYLFLKHGSDKGSSHHNLSDIYTKYIDGENIMFIMEYGVYAGASLRSFSEYLPNGLVVGVDRMPVPGAIPANAVVIQADQNSWLDTYQILSIYGLPDMVIDDCSHLVQDQISTFGYVSQYAKEGMIYVIEDVIEENIDMVASYMNPVSKDLEIIRRGKWGFLFSKLRKAWPCV